MGCGDRDVARVRGAHTYKPMYAPSRGRKAKATAQGITEEQYALQVLEQDLAPAWLRQSWATAKETGLDQLSTDEIDAEIAAARKARREANPHPGA